ncbi:MAG: hypothetical protein AB7D41_03985 [Arcobacter sp.]|uniref:hypothetical protein n=1 Tax=Arcobacter sp. TaxID=1872629 RepID=UPI003D04D854
MRKSFYSFLNESKTKIGWVHGILTIVFSVVLAYLFAMLFSTFAFKDYAIKIIPAMILTPILISFFGIYLLNSVSILNMLKKFLIFFLLFIILLFWKI